MIKIRPRARLARVPVEEHEGSGAGAVDRGGQTEDDPPGARRRQTVARDGVDHRGHHEAGGAVRQSPADAVQGPGIVWRDVLKGRESKSNLGK